MFFKMNGIRQQRSLPLNVVRFLCFPISCTLSGVLSPVHRVDLDPLDPIDITEELLIVVKLLCSNDSLLEDVGIVSETARQEQAEDVLVGVLEH